MEETILGQLMQLPDWVEMIWGFVGLLFGFRANKTYRDRKDRKRKNNIDKESK